MVNANPDVLAFSQVFKQDPPEKFKTVLNQFLDAGKAGDIEAMTGLSSKLTIERIGLSRLKAAFKNDFIPILQSCESFANNKVITHVTAQQTGTGSGYMYQFSCSRSDKSQQKFKASVLNENNQIMMTFFGLDS